MTPPEENRYKDISGKPLEEGFYIWKNDLVFFTGQYSPSSEHGAICLQFGYINPRNFPLEATLQMTRIDPQTHISDLERQVSWMRQLIRVHNPDTTSRSTSSTCPKNPTDSIIKGMNPQGA